MQTCYFVQKKMLSEKNKIIKYYEKVNKKVKIKNHSSASEVTRTFNGKLEFQKKILVYVMQNLLTIETKADF